MVKKFNVFLGEMCPGYMCVMKSVCVTEKTALPLGRMQGHLKRQENMAVMMWKRLVLSAGGTCESYCPVFQFGISCSGA